MSAMGTIDKEWLKDAVLNALLVFSLGLLVVGYIKPRPLSKSDNPQLTERSSGKLQTLAETPLSELQEAVLLPQQEPVATQAQVSATEQKPQQLAPIEQPQAAQRTTASPARSTILTETLRNTLNLTKNLRL